MQSVAVQHVRVDTWQARPDWHRSASCRGMGAATWCLSRSDGDGDLEVLRDLCRGCPVSGPCMRYAVTELTMPECRFGPVRCGVHPAQWRSVRRLVNALDPQTDDDWDAAADLWLDGASSVPVPRRLKKAG